MDPFLWGPLALKVTFGISCDCLDVNVMYFLYGFKSYETDNLLTLFRLPVLAGAAGTLGATYCPPYIAVEGGYHARPSGQSPSLPSTSV